MLWDSHLFNPAKLNGNRKFVNILIMTSISVKFKNLVLYVIAMLPLFASAQWQQSFSYKGDWSSWKTEYGQISHYTDDSGIILKTSGGQTYFSFQINNYVPPTKKQLKEHLKSGKWFEYTGTVEYSVNDTYPTAEDLARASRFVIPNPRVDQTPSVLRRTTCKIRIEPYKKLPSNYNVFFDNIGVAISIQGMTFQGQKKHTNGGRVVANIAQSLFLFPIGIGSWWWNPVREYDKR